jgi:hypothetical protein
MINIIKLTILLTLLAFNAKSTIADASPLLNTTTIQISAAGLTSKSALGRCAAHQKFKPEGIVVLLHGRGGHTAIEKLVNAFPKFACRRNFAVVAPAAPTANKNWPFEKKQGEKQDLFLLELLQKNLRQTFSMNEKTPIHLVGISAGATFLMGDFYPRHGFKLNGLAAALCGGSWPTQSEINGFKDIEKHFPLFVQISKQDFLFRQTEAGLKRYTDLGLPLRAKITEETGHCAFDFEESLERIAAMIQ